jgi:hypothetical protein
MTTAGPIRTTNNSQPPGEASVRRIRFVQQASVGQEVLLEFLDPAPYKAVSVSTGPDSRDESPGSIAGEGLDILLVNSPPNDQLAWSDQPLNWVMETTLPGTAPPVAITIHGAQVIWGSSRAAILAAPDRAAPFLLALVDFSYYEIELRKLEREIAENWPLLELDTPLTNGVTVPDPERFEAIGQRMMQTFRRRMRLARIAPHLSQPRGNLSPLANQLLDRLREKNHVEERVEALGSQLEVFERIYEMTSQKISDFTSSRKERTLEWVIIVLLAAEVVLLLIDILWSMRDS